jgi:hypothetical protein
MHSWRRLVLVVVVTLAWASAVGHTYPVAAATPRIQFGVGGFNMVRENPDGWERLTAYSNLRELGVTWVRTEISWDKVEVSPGRYNWGSLDRLAKEVRAAGLKLLAVVHRTPDYYRPLERPEWYPPVGPGPLAAWARFLRTMALRYTRPGAERIRAVEVWNEENNPLAWDGPMTMSRYVNLLKGAHHEFKAVNPTTSIITGGLAPGRDTSTSVNPRTFVQRLYAAGAKRYFDAIAMHPYTFPALASDNLKTGWGNMTRSDGGKPSMRATMIANGDGAKKIWNTEFGSPVKVVGEARQAKIATDAVKVWRSYTWAGPFFYMAYKDQTSLPGWHKTLGLIRGDDTRRPVFSAFKSAIRAAA